MKPRLSTVFAPAERLGLSRLCAVRFVGVIACIIAMGMLAGTAGAVEYFVKMEAEGGDDANTGLDWDNALATVAAGIAKADSTIVTVRAGTYDVAAQLTLDKAITVRSELGGLGGAAQTIVQRPSSASLNYRVFLINHADAVVQGLTIRGGKALANNTAPGLGGAGGGIFIATSGGTVRDCIVTGNEVVHGTDSPHTKGGGIYASAGLVLNTVISNNTASATINRAADGGGAFLLGTAVMDRCLIAHNESISSGSADRRGGGLYLAASTAIARNCLIRNNKVTGTVAIDTRRDGGGVYLQDGLLENCTVVANQGIRHGGGIYRITGGNVCNSIIVFNTAPTDANYSGAAANLSYSCTEAPLVVNTGNIAADPAFEDRAAGDFRLKTTSPCVVKGHPGPYEGDLAWIAEVDAIDLAGQPRLMNKRLDMGAYETLLPPVGTLILLR